MQPTSSMTLPVPSTTPSTRRSHLVSFLVLLGLIAVCELVGVLGALVTDPGFYEQLVRPSWAPPASVFGPVWTTLYALMAVAAWLVWRTGPRSRGPLIWFAVQLALNALWSPVFFGLHSLGGGLIVIVMLELAILQTIRSFAPRSRLAALLMVPYAAWVAFATALNAAIWWLNR